jgi:hypothetical protein
MSEMAILRASTVTHCNRSLLQDALAKGIEHPVTSLDRFWKALQEGFEDEGAALLELLSWSPAARRR